MKTIIMRMDKAPLDRAIGELESVLNAVTVTAEFIDATMHFMEREAPFAFHIDRGPIQMSNLIVMRPQTTDRFRALLAAIRAGDFNLASSKTPDLAEHASPA